MGKLSAFVAYRHTGEDEAELEKLLNAVCFALEEAGVEPYCTFFSEKDLKAKQTDAKEIMSQAFDAIDSKDFLFVVQTSDNKSEGMLMEVGYCLAKNKPIVVATQSDVSVTYLPKMADSVIEFNDIDDLKQMIKQLDLSNVIQ